MRTTIDPDTVLLIAVNQTLIETAREMVAKSRRECELARAAIEESRRLRDRWRGEIRR